MCRNELLLIILTFCLQSIAYSQNRTIQSKLVDSTDNPIMYATVMLQASDKEIIAAQLSDSVGRFKFTEIPLPVCIMIIQHISYESDTIVINNWQTPASIRLKEKTNTLGEIIISAKTPFLKVKDGVFIYNMSHIQHNRAVLNAYESLREIPGVIEDSRQLLLTGSSELKIIVDGQQSSLSTEQTLAMLKSIPASKIKEIEVMYDAPSRYNTQGAVINIKLKEKTDNGHPFAGEVMMGYAQSYYASASPNVSLSLAKKKFRMDVTGNLKKGKTWNCSTAYTQHSIGGNMDVIDEETVSRGNSTSFNSRIGVNYKFNSQNNITFSYYYQGVKDITANISNTFYNSGSDIRSRNANRDHNYLHNLNLQYTFRNMNVGMDYIHFHNPTTIKYQDNSSEEQNELKDLSLQNVDKYSFFINHALPVGPHFHLSYGTNLKYNLSKSNIDYYYAEGDKYIEEKENGLHSKQKETDLSLFVEAKCKVDEHWSVRAALKSNYFKSEYDDNDTKRILWNDFILFPNFSLSYTPNNSNNFQLSFSTNRRYPPYWAINPQTTNLSSYTSIAGNPELKPSRIFSGRFIYTFQKKYTLIGTIQYSPDFFTQIPHMTEDRLKMVYRYENFDYRLQSGLMLLVPVQWWHKVDTRFTLIGSRTEEKIARFYNSSFDNIFYDAYVSMNNSLKLASRWLLQLDINYRSPSRQGVYKLGYTLGGSVRLKWDVTNAAYVTLRYDNLFRRQMPRPMEICYGEQYRSIRNEEKSEFGISFTWTIGNFKSRRYNMVDTQRLNK